MLTKNYILYEEEFDGQQMRTQDLALGLGIPSVEDARG